MTVYRRPDPIPLRRAANSESASHGLIAPVRAESDDLNRLVARQIFQAILGGRFAPGAILPNEHQLAADLGVSRTALREAIRGLVAKGVLETRRKRGTQVLDRSLWNMLDPDVIAWSRRDGNRRVSEELWGALLVAVPGIGTLATTGQSGDNLQLEARRTVFCAEVMAMAQQTRNRFVLSLVASCLRSLCTEDPAFLDAQLDALAATKETV